MPNFTEEEKTQLKTLKQLVTDFVKDIESSIDKTVKLKVEHRPADVQPEESQSYEQAIAHFDSLSGNQQYSDSYKAWIQLIAIFNKLEVYNYSNPNEATQKYKKYLLSEDYQVQTSLTNSFYANEQYQDNDSNDYSLTKLLTKISESYTALHESLKNKTASAGVFTTLFSRRHDASIKKEVELLKVFRENIQDFCNKNEIYCNIEKGKLSLTAPIQKKSARK